MRGAGYVGPITVIGDEPHLPYNRPPLSKEALASGADPDSLAFRRRPTTDDIVWMLGTRVAACSLADRIVTLEDGTVVPFDGMVVASGIRPRRLPIPGPTAGRHVLRTLEDANELRAELVAGANAIIMGAGFIGCETAATARKLGANVTIVALDEEPMIRPLGPDLGAAMRRRHESRGVRFHLGRTITSFNGDEHVQSVSLSDGTELPATVVIEAVGSVANVEWLEGNGLDLSDGVLVDDGMRAATNLAPVVAVGDVARHPNARFGGPARRIEHWNMPSETGRRAGATLATLLAGQEPALQPFTGMPSFWSDQYADKLQSFGMPGLATSIVVADGDVDGPCIVEYHDDSGLLGVVSINRTQDLAPYRTSLLERVPASA